MDITSLFDNDIFTKMVQSMSYDSIKFHHKQSSAKVFIIKNTNYCFNVKRDSYKILLQNCLKTFETNEDYEKCVECKYLIETL